MDMVKIDRRFVANLGRGEQDAAIIESSSRWPRRSGSA